MTGIIKSKILLIIPLLIEVCFLSSSAQAKYSGGTGEPDDPYQIATAEDLILLGESPEDYGKHFILTADIDLDPNLPGRKVFDKAVIGVMGQKINRTVIVEYLIPFAGVFDGNEHTILHLTIDGGGCLGLFGRLETGAEVRDLGMVDVNITGSGNSAGGLVGSNGGAVIACYSTGTVSGGSMVGGLVGYNGGAVTDCYSTGTVSGGGMVGGLVGDNGGDVTYCYSSSEVSGSGYYVGGLVGHSDSGHVTYCYSTGSVSGGEIVGGLVGGNLWEGMFYLGPRYHLVSNCYSTGSVSGDFRVGGLVGYNRGTITNCYSTGSISGNESVGGLVGENINELAAACFWDIQTSGQATSDGGTGLTTKVMQDIQTYWDAGWDFAGEIKDGLHDHWQMPEGGGYPVLAIPRRLQGQGTPEDPYLIFDAFDLGAIVHYSTRAHYQLVASIDLSGISWFRPVVPSFEGTFNGNGHTISHLIIEGGNYPISSYLIEGVGLFGRLESGAELKNLGVVDANVTGSDFVGGLVAFNEGEVATCYSTGAVTGNMEVGGLVGRNPGDVTSCYSTVSVSGKGGVGGLVGSNGGAVTLCYSAGAVSGSGKDIGGLVGSGGPGSVQNSVWDIETSGISGSAGGVGLTTAEMIDPYMLGLNAFANEPNWILDPGRDYPRLAWEGTPGGIIQEPNIDWLEGNGTEGNPYRIEIAEQLILLGKTSILWDKHFILVTDIDLNPTLPDGQAFGQAVIPNFLGVFDGNEHTISHLTIDGGGCLGLFGRLETGAEVRDLGMVDVNITGSGNSAGGLVGSNGGAVIACYSTGTVSEKGADWWEGVGGLVGSNGGSIDASYSSGAVNGDNNVGGLVGRSTGNITTSYSTGAVSGHLNVGGLVGDSYYRGYVTDCYSTGSVSGGEIVGGLVGCNSGVIISSSYSTSTVTGDTYVGGLIGDNDGLPSSVNTSYSTGTVIGQSVVGGLVGCTGYGATIIKCYSTNSVTGEYEVGGLVGLVKGLYEVMDSFWDVQTSGQTESAGGTGKTTAQMQTATTFLEVGWDFVNETPNGTEDIWWILEGQDYPRLWWELI